MGFSFRSVTIPDGTVPEIPARYRLHDQWVPRIGDRFPDLTAVSTRGRLSLGDLAQGRWLVLVAMRGAYTPVSSTEILALGALADDFAQAGAVVAGIACDAPKTLDDWQADVGTLAGVDLDLPLLADPDGTIARTCGLIHPRCDLTVCAPTTLILDPARQICAITSHSPEVGRDFAETLRTLRALRRHEQDGALLPAQWHDGKPTILPHEMPTEDAAALHGADKVVARHFLRLLRG